MPPRFPPIFWLALSVVACNDSSPETTDFVDAEDVNAAIDARIAANDILEPADIAGLLDEAGVDDVIDARIAANDILEAADIGSLVDAAAVDAIIDARIAANDILEPADFGVQQRTANFTDNDFAHGGYNTLAMTLALPDGATVTLLRAWVNNDDDSAQEVQLLFVKRDALTPFDADDSFDDTTISSDTQAVGGDSPFDVTDQALLASVSLSEVIDSVSAVYVVQVRGSVSDDLHVGVLTVHYDQPTLP